MSQPLTVVATLKAKPGKEDALHAALFALVAPTRKENGCINYDMHRSADDPGSFVFHENWTTRPLWDAHMNSPHLQAFSAQQDALVADWQLFAGYKV